MRNYPMLKSWLKVFLATIAASLMANGGDIFSTGWSDLKVIISGGVAALLPLIITYLDPNDNRWGK